MSYSYTDSPEYRVECQPELDAIYFAHGAGLLLVASAGNLPLFPIVTLPAAWDHVVAVSAVTCQANSSQSCGTTATFHYGSAQGAALDLAAAGEWVAVARVGGGIDFASGTSIAAPMVSAAALVLMSTYPDAQRQGSVVEQWLKMHAYPPAGGRYDPVLYGAGILDIRTAVEAGNPCAVLECSTPPDPW